ncbi:Gti1/Pac2 family-domain-containing protein [Mycena epipterygia]|nr:Gti1/Pac2 family-domain-containing protein [Mycena epipterygia]
MPEPVTTLNVTHSALRLFSNSDSNIRNVSDVLVVLEAVRRGILPLITLRMSVNDRYQLRNGNVFVWEESPDEGGLVRWTDGRRWSQSKVCANCLFYEEKVDVTEEEREAKALRRARRICNPGLDIRPPRRNQRPSKSGGLTKQTYSFLVQLPGSCEARKWHIVAYSLWPDRARLPVIEDYPVLRDIRVPMGVFARSKAFDTVPVYHSSHLATESPQGSCRNMRPTADTPRLLQMVRTSACHHPVPAQGPELPSFSPGRDTGTDIVLPPISWLSSPSWGSIAAYNFPPVPPHNWHPVSQEDRRILDSFRLSL